MLPLATKSKQRSGRLLIVDDESHIRSALRRALTETGHEVYEAATGQQALELLKTVPFDVLVLDLRMRELDGTDVIHQAMEIRPTVSIIVLTGYASLESAITAVKSPLVVDYLEKPVGLRVITTAVDAALARTGKQAESVALQGSEGTSGRDSAETAQQPQTIQADPLVFDQHRRILTSTTNATWRCELTANEAAVLSALMAEPDNVLSCSDLGYTVWNRYVAEQQAQGPIRLIIYRLRRKVHTLPAHVALIRTVRGSGYTLY